MIKRSRKQRKLDREKLNRHLEAWSRIFGKSFNKLMKDKKCAICGEKGGGLGDGVVYCEKHFWSEFDEKHGE